MQPRSVKPTNNGCTNARRSTRVATDILIEVQGEGFAYAGEAVTVSLHGGLIRTSAPLRIGMKILVYVHQTHEAAPAHVVFEECKKQGHYGIAFDRPGNIWGLAPTPHDEEWVL